MIINNTTSITDTEKAVKLSYLSIVDSIVDSSNTDYGTPNWTYTSNRKPFDATNFTLEPRETIEVIASEWVVPTPGVDQSYKATNTVTLNRNGIKLDDSKVELEIARPSLRILKQVKEGSTVVDDNTGFTITVSGSDGTKYNVKLKSGEDCTLENLKYGVKYTISELPVMNYKLKGFTTSKQNLGTSNTLRLVMNSGTDNILVTVNNVRSNDKWFSDTAITENKITYPLQNSTK